MPHSTDRTVHGLHVIDLRIVKLIEMDKLRGWLLLCSNYLIVIQVQFNVENDKFLCSIDGLKKQ